MCWARCFQYLTKRLSKSFLLFPEDPATREPGLGCLLDSAPRVPLLPLRAPWDAVLAAMDSRQSRGQTRGPQPQIPSLAPVLSPLKGWTSQPPFPAQHRIMKPILHDPPLSAAPSTGHRGSCTLWQPPSARDHCPVSRTHSPGGRRGQGCRRLAVLCNPKNRSSRPTPAHPSEPRPLSPCLGGHGCPGACWAE